MQAYESLHLIAHRQARRVLLWFMLSLGMAVAAPVLAPTSMQLICSVMSPAQMVELASDGTPVEGVTILKCPLCLAPVLAPPPTAVGLCLPPPATSVVVAVPQQPHGLLPKLTIQARGPPLLDA